MFGVLFLFVSAFSVLTLSFAFENDVNHPYDLNRMARRYSSAVGMQEKSQLLNDFLFDKLGQDFSLDDLPIPSLDSSKCVKDVLYTFQSLSNFTQNMWAWRMIDSFAKPPDSGFLIGNTKWIGEYNECKDVHAPPNASDSSVGNFNGQYCTVSATLQLKNASFPLSMAICLPDSCNPLELQAEILQLLLKAGKFPVLIEETSEGKPAVTLACEPKEKPWTAAAICVIVLLSFLCYLSLMGSTITAVKYFRKMALEHSRSSLVINVPNDDIKHDPESAVKKHPDAEDANLLPSPKSSGVFHNIDTFLSCFCIFNNGAKLLNTDSSEGQLLCIHGIRFLSMSWVILGHAYMFGVQQMRNMSDGAKIVDDFAFQAVLQGFFSVDSFFVLSGFLLTYLAMKELSKAKGSFNWPYFYIHRYIRLTPLYMIVLGFSASVFFYLGSGPFWPVADHDELCRKYWWKNLLYINNFNSQQQMCMGWSWYLANDMQFFVISPILLISLWKWPVIGYGVFGLFLVASMVANFVITYHYDLMVGIVGLNLSDAKSMLLLMAKFMEFFDKIYIKPYTRIGPYLVGMVAGHILYKHKTSNWPKLRWVHLSIGWIVASSVTLTCVYGLYHAHPGLIARSIFNAVNRTLYGCGLSWVIYVCLTEQSNIINSILSYKLFIPLSRLTYAAYLIHPLILTGYFTSLKAPFEFSHPTLVLLYLGFIVVTYALALPVSLILESPIVSLEKMIRNKFTKKLKEPCQ